MRKVFSFKSLGWQLLVIVIVFLAVRTYLSHNAITGKIPAFTGTLLTGEEYSSSELSGKPALIHFWATWCRICRWEQSSINSLAKDYPVVTVVIQSGVEAEVQQHMQQNQLDYLVLLDEDGSLARMFGIVGVPTSFILDADGDIRFVDVGFTTEWGFRFRLWWARLF